MLHTEGDMVAARLGCAENVHRGVRAALGLDERARLRVMFGGECVPEWSTVQEWGMEENALLNVSVAAFEAKIN